MIKHSTRLIYHAFIIQHTSDTISKLSSSKHIQGLQNFTQKSFRKLGKKKKLKASLKTAFCFTSISQLVTKIQRFKALKRWPFKEYAEW